MTLEEHQAALHAAMKAEHEEYEQQVRRWAEQAADVGNDAGVRQHRAHLARLQAMPKPWDTATAA